jgi:elongation factor 1-gamma
MVWITKPLSSSRQGAPQLYGKSNIEAGLIDQWIDFAVSEIELPAYAWLLPIQGVIPNNPAATKKAQDDIKRVLGILDHHLLTRTYFVGNTVTLADIVLACSLLQLYEAVLEPAFRKDFINTNRWFTTVINQPQFKAVIGEVKLCEKMQAAPAKEKKEKQPKAEQKPKEQPAKKKEEPKKKEEEPQEEPEEDYEEKEEKKEKNPLDLLPKSPFVMDEWKRMYSNNDTRSVALPWFSDHFDKEGYSVFWCDYKYNDELEKIFMTNNLIGGFFQRLEKLHKYAFGSMLIFGEEPKLSVSGVWVFRGPDVPKEMAECDDYTNYEWRRSDLSDPAQKKLFEDYLAWDGELGGKKFSGSAKIFK